MLYRSVVPGALVVVVLAAGCADSGTAGQAPAPTVGQTPVEQPSSYAPTGTVTGVPTPRSTPSRAQPPRSSSTKPTRKPTSTSSPSPSRTSGTEGKRPVINVFIIKSRPSCPSTGPNVSAPGTPVVLEWKTADTEKLTISIDGPGIYDSYPSTHSAELPFACSGTPGSSQVHRYLLTATGGGHSIQRTLTVQARVN